MTDIGAHHVDRLASRDSDNPGHPFVGLPDGNGRHRSYVDRQPQHELGGGAHQSAESTPGDAGPSLSRGLGHVLGLADTADPVDGIWAVVRLRRHDGERVKTIRCSLRVIEAATENEAWGRLWSALLTSGITPTIDDGSLVWQEPDPNGGQAHFGISLLPAQPHADRSMPDTLRVTGIHDQQGEHHD